MAINRNRNTLPPSLDNGRRAVTTTDGQDPTGTLRTSPDRVRATPLGITDQSGHLEDEDQSARYERARDKSHRVVPNSPGAAI